MVPVGFLGSLSSDPSVVRERVTCTASDFRYGSFKMPPPPPPFYLVTSSSAAFELKIAVGTDVLPKLYLSFQHFFFSVFYEPRKALALERERQLEYPPGVWVVVSVQ